MKTTALFVSTALLLTACEDPTPSAGAASAVAQAPSATASASAAAPPASASAAAPQASASAAAPTPPLQVLRLTLTSEVKQKEPVDELHEARPGQRIWAHVALRNRASDARRVSVIFKVDGEERSTVDLKVASSWSFRTWAYNTLRPGDKTGELTVEVRDDASVLIGQAKLPIKAAAAAKAGEGK